MIELRSDSLVFSFPDVHPKAKLTVTFQRTLRIPDDGREWPLPPGLGAFPLRHIDDFQERVPQAWCEHGGVLLPMYQAEAMWLSFDSDTLSDHDAPWPFAVKIATGKRSAVTGDAWALGLSRAPQDYLVIPEQPWLDGYVVEKGCIRQFVAMPLGEGYTAEEQITGSATIGGLQIEVRPMHQAAFSKRWPKRKRQQPRFGGMVETCCDASLCCPPSEEMGLAPGGKMRQEVYEDPFDLKEWALNETARCFIHIANSETWQGITGEAPPTVPPTARDYSNMGLPWFDYYDGDAKALKGTKQLADLTSVAELAKSKGSLAIGDASGVAQITTVLLGKPAVRVQVREGAF
jgi:hypothetical protein